MEQERNRASIEDAVVAASDDAEWVLSAGGSDGGSMSTSLVYH